MASRVSLLLGLVVFALPARAQTAQPTGVTLEQYERAKSDGRAAAKDVGTTGWFFGGFAGGAIGSLVGTGVAFAVAASSDAPLPPAQRLAITNEPQQYQIAYAEAYSAEVRSQRKGQALAGGLIATGVVATIILTSMSHK